MFVCSIFKISALEIFEAYLLPSGKATESIHVFCGKELK